MNRYYLILTLLLCAMSMTTVPVAASDEPAPSGSGNIVQTVKRYLIEDSAQAQEREKKRFRFSVVGGPNYASDTKLGIGVAGMINYRLNGCEAPMNSSYATVAVNVTTAKFWSVSLAGTTYFAGDKMRLGTDWWLGYSPRDFYGWGFDYCDDDARKGKLHQREIKIKEELLLRAAPNFFLGPVVEWNYNSSGDVLPDDSYLEGQDHVVRNYGAGITLLYDSRDVPTEASHGLYLYLCQMFRPKFLGNKYHFATTDFRACYYHTAWRDAIIAGELRTLFNIGDPSWAMMALLGNSSFMRGYYKGRYRDKHMWAAQVELRQHIWKKSGIAVWLGAGNVFHDGKTFRHVLPNYGIGYRFAFRKHSNIRLDMGFGKSGQHGFNFSINEAF